MNRRTTGLSQEEAALVALYATPGSEANRALGALMPEVPVRSESSAIRALLLVGHRAVEEERLQAGYDLAVEAGEVDAEAVAWHTAAAHHAALLWAQE